MQFLPDYRHFLHVLIGVLIWCPVWCCICMYLVFLFRSPVYVPVYSPQSCIYIFSIQYFGIFSQILCFSVFRACFVHSLRSCICFSSTQSLLFFLVLTALVCECFLRSCFCILLFIFFPVLTVLYLYIFSIFLLYLCFFDVVSYNSYDFVFKRL